MNPPLPPDRDSLLRWLRESDPKRIARLFRQADRVRLQHVGNEVHLRGLIEVSNHCRRHCGYCGIRADNTSLRRYRMSPDEVLHSAREAKAGGCGTVVIQAGEDPKLDSTWVASLVRRVRRETGLAVTLSLGEHSAEVLQAWRTAGAERYLLRFETSDPELFERIHPSTAWGSSDRIGMLRTLRELGYEVGSGVMVGIPGQTWSSLVNDLLLFGSLDLDMIGIGPFIPHPATPLGKATKTAGREQVPATSEVTCRVLALARLVCPEANIPSTTALSTLNRATGRDLGLQCGANVVMPNVTPTHYRELYQIYPHKVSDREVMPTGTRDFDVHLSALGRRVGSGPGGRTRRAPLNPTDPAPPPASR